MSLDHLVQDVPHITRQDDVSDSRLMSSTPHLAEWLATGQVKDYAELSAITGLDRSRITRIMNLRLLEPETQEKMVEYFSL